MINRRELVPKFSKAINDSKNDRLGRAIGEAASPRIGDFIEKRRIASTLLVAVGVALLLSSDSVSATPRIIATDNNPGIYLQVEAQPEPVGEVSSEPRSVFYPPQVDYSTALPGEPRGGNGALSFNPETGESLSDYIKRGATGETLEDYRNRTRP